MQAYNAFIFRQAISAPRPADMRIIAYSIHAPGNVQAHALRHRQAAATQTISKDRDLQPYNMRHKPNLQGVALSNFYANHCLAWTCVLLLCVLGKPKQAKFEGVGEPPRPCPLPGAVGTGDYPFSPHSMNFVKHLLAKVPTRPSPLTQLKFASFNLKKSSPNAGVRGGGKNGRLTPGVRPVDIPHFCWRFDINARKGIAPLRLLHRLQIGRILAGKCAPPLASGITWSMSVAFSPQA